MAMSLVSLIVSPKSQLHTLIVNLGTKKKISEVFYGEGVVHKEIQGIFNYFESFYRWLYSRAVCGDLKQINFLISTEIRDEQTLDSFFLRKNITRPQRVILRTRHPDLMVCLLSFKKYFSLRYESH